MNRKAGADTRGVKIVTFLRPQSEADRKALQREREAGRLDPGPENRRPPKVIH